MKRVPEDIWITITDLRRNIHRVLREVERGAMFTVVRRGRPVARLLPHKAGR
jgi:prevent-host-death family protein